MGFELRPQNIPDERTQAQNQEVEQPLGARASVLWKEFIHKDIDGCKEECIANAVEENACDDRNLVRKKCEDSKADGMAQNADGHRRAPSELLEHSSQHGHRADLGEL